VVLDIKMNVPIFIPLNNAKDIREYTLLLQPTAPTAPTANM